MKSKLKIYAKKLRDNPTRSESKAASLMRKANIGFLEQVPFKYYILDFIVPSRLLIVEVDGWSHKKRKAYDGRRDKFCLSRGLNVLRIKNEDVGRIITEIKRFPKIKGFKKKLEEILKKL